MVDAITKKAFPALHRVVDSDHEKLPEREVREALRAELDVLVKASWQQHQTKRRPDRESKVAAMMGTSPKLVARWGKQYAAQHGAREPEPSKPKGSRKK